MRFSIILFFLILMLNFASSFNYLHLKSTPGPDSLQIDFFSNQLLSNGSLKYCSNISYEGINIIGSRGMLETIDGCKTHGSMHGFIIINALIKLSSKELFFAFYYLFNLLSLFYFYRIEKIYFSEKNALLGLIIFSLLTPFFLYSNTDYNNIPFLAFLLMSAYYFLKADGNEGADNFIIFPLLLGVAFTIRYPDILFFIPFIFLKPLSHIKKDFKRYILSGLIFILFIIMIFIINLSLFGSIIGFSTASQLGLQTNFYSDRSNPIIPPFSFIDPNIAIKNTINYIIILYPLLFFIFLGVLRKKNLFIWPLILSFISLVLIYFGGIWTGFNDLIPSPGHVYDRYALIFFMFYTLFLTNYLIKVYNKRILIILLSISMILNILISFTSVGGIMDFENSHMKFKSTKQFFLNNTIEDSIVFTKYYDKYIFPERATAIYPSFNESTRVNNTVSLIIFFISLNKTIYFLEEDAYTNRDVYLLKDYSDKLNEFNLTLVNINGVIYKVNLENETKQ